MRKGSSASIEIQEIMTKDPIAIDVSSSVQAVVDQMFSHDIRHIPVVKGKTLVGMISDRDIQGYCLQLDKPVNQEVETAQNLEEIVQNDVIFVHPNTEVIEVIDLMIDHKVGAIPVVEEKTNQLVGIVSYIDILQLAGEYL